MGQKPLGPNEYYLGVFMRVQNEGDTSAQVPTDLSVVDTVGDTFRPLPSDSLFALKLGDTLHAGDELPEGGVRGRERTDPGIDGPLPHRQLRDSGPAADPSHHDVHGLDRRSRA